MAGAGGGPAEARTGKGGSWAASELAWRRRKFTVKEGLERRGGGSTSGEGLGGCVAGEGQRATNLLC